MIASTLRDQEFSDFSFPRELQRRGFGGSTEDDGVQGYYYRDDGFLLWDALKK